MFCSVHTTETDQDAFGRYEYQLECHFSNPIQSKTILHPWQWIGCIRYHSCMDRIPFQSKIYSTVDTFFLAIDNVKNGMVPKE